MVVRWLMGEAMPQESNRITLKRDVRDRFGLRVPNVHFNDHQRYLAMNEHPYVRGRVGLRRRDATRTFRVRAISRWSQPRYRSHARAAGGRASETSPAARRMCRTYSGPMAA